MKNEILKLRNEGKTYREIQEILNCSKSIISYYCGKGQKDMAKKRVQKRRTNPIIRKIDGFKYAKSRNIKEQVRRFNKRDNDVKRKIDKNIENNFTFDDVIKKFGVDTHCYLSGEKLNLYDTICSFDHILPSSRNGDNSLKNLGITHKIVNSMKHNLTPEELIQWCVKILKYNGYSINKLPSMS